MAFCSTTLRSSDLREVYRTPGPAYYEVMHKDRSVSLGDPSFRSQLHRLDGLKSSNEVPGPGMYEHNVAPRADGKATWRQLRRGFALRHKTPPATPREDTVDQLYVAPTKAPARKLLCMVPKKEQRIVSRQAMKSLLCSPGESIPSLSQEQVCIWIGTDSTQVPVRRRKMLGKVFQPSSAFASGTSRRSEAEREGPGPASCAPEGFAELAERQRRHRAARRAPQAPQVPFGSTSTAREQPRGSPELGPGYYDLDVPLPETVRRSPSPAFGTQQQRFYRDRSETPGPADYARCGASAWEDASTAAPSGVEDSTTPPLAFGTRQDRACAMTSTPTLEERDLELLPVDPLGRLNSLTRRALRRAYGAHGRPAASPGASPAPGDYDPMPCSGQLWRMPPEEEVFSSTEPRFRRDVMEMTSLSPGPAFYSPMPQSPTPPCCDFSSSNVMRFLESPLPFDDAGSSGPGPPELIVEGLMPRERYLSHGNGRPISLIGRPDTAR